MVRVKASFEEKRDTDRIIFLNFESWLGHLFGIFYWHLEFYNWNTAER